MSDTTDILTKMLDAVPDSYQKTVLFPTYDILAAAAIPMTEQRVRLEEVKSKLDPENLVGEELDAYIRPRSGLVRNAATYAVGELSVAGNGTVTAGDLFESGGGVQFIATETVAVNGSAIVPIRCVQAGAAGNLPASSITMMPVQIAGIISVTNTAPTSDGYDAESDSAYLARFYLRLRTPPTSGNQYHYRNWALEVSGVGGVQIYPLGHGANTVDVVIIDSSGKPASSALVAAVQGYIDPGSKGIGEGAAPVGAYCYVSAAEGVTLDLSLTVTPFEGAEQSAVTQAIKDAAEAYLASIAFKQNYVSFTKLSDAILGAPGVEDHSGLSINGTAANVSIGARKVAVLGEVSVAYAT